MSIEDLVLDQVDVLLGLVRDNSQIASEAILEHLEEIQAIIRG